MLYIMHNYINELQVVVCLTQSLSYSLKLTTFPWTDAMSTGYCRPPPSEQTHMQISECTWGPKDQPCSQDISNDFELKARISINSTWQQCAIAIAIAIPPEKGEKLEWLTATFAIGSPHFDQPNANVSDFVNVMTGLHSFWIRKRLLHGGFAMEGVGLPSGFVGGTKQLATATRRRHVERNFPAR